MVVQVLPRAPVVHCQHPAANRMKSLIACTIIFLSAGRLPAQTADAMLATFFREHLDASFQLRPAHATALGEQFNLSRYHEAVLSNGSIPLKFLPGLVRAQLGLRDAPPP